MPFSKWVCSLVPTDPADLDIKGRSQVADITIIRTGKVVKGNHKTLRQREHKFKDDVDQNNNSTSLKNTTTIANIPAFTKSEDLEVMSFFLLPAEYASVCGTSPWKANAS